MRRGCPPRRAIPAFDGPKRRCTPSCRGRNPSDRSRSDIGYIPVPGQDSADAECSKGSNWQMPPISGGGCSLSVVPCFARRHPHRMVPRTGASIALTSASLRSGTGVDRRPKSWLVRCWTLHACGIVDDPAGPVRVQSYGQVIEVARPGDRDAARDRPGYLPIGLQETAHEEMTSRQAVLGCRAVRRGDRPRHRTVLGRRDCQATGASDRRCPAPPQRSTATGRGDGWACAQERLRKRATSWPVIGRRAGGVVRSAKMFRPAGPRPCAARSPFR